MMTSRWCQHVNHEYIEFVTEILTANEPIFIVLLHHEHTEQEGHKRNQFEKGCKVLYRLQW